VSKTARIIASPKTVKPFDHDESGMSSAPTAQTVVSLTPADFARPVPGAAPANAPPAPPATD